jgi:hypothetical protein
MKKLIDSTDAEGLESLLGEYVLIWCECYIYYGRLVGVDEKDVVLEEAAVVYQTGPFSDEKLKDCQPLQVQKWYVRTSKIESYGVWKKQ